MQKIIPFLYFDGNAEEAANFYVSVFRPTTGFSWRTARLTEKPWSRWAIRRTRPIRTGRALTGVGGMFLFMFKAVKPGKTQASLEYARPWEKDKKPVQTFAVTIEVEEK